MSPSLRYSLSTTPSTPSGKAGGDSPSVSNARKSPTCKTCGRRRAGHPRSGCPSTSSPSPPPTGREPEITDALQSLDIKYVPPNDTTPPRRKGRKSSVKIVQEASLASLSSIANEAIDRLLQPGIISDEISDDEEGQKKRAKRWQETMVTSSTKMTRRSLRSASVMPGTLLTPSASFMSDRDIPQDPLLVASQETSVVSVHVVDPDPPGPPVHTPLSRTLSVEERNAFLSKLAQTSPTVPTTVFQLPINEIPSIQQTAMKLGFFSRVMPGLDGVHGFLILGRDDSSVEEFFEGAKEQAKKRVGVRGNRVTSLAGGAVVGAVAAFTGLALS